MAIMDALLNPTLGPVDTSAPANLSTVTNAAAPTTPTDYSQFLTPDDVAWKNRHSGVQGVARTVLGHLGDFLLSKLHMGTPYADSQKQHEFNYAFDQGGNEADPAAQLHAIGLVEQKDRVLGSKLRDQFIDNQRLQAGMAQTAESRAQRLAISQQAIDQRSQNNIGNLVNTIDPNDTPEKQQAKFQYIKGLTQRYARKPGTLFADDPGFDPNALLGDSYDPDLTPTLANGGVSVVNQRKLDQGDRRQDEVENNHNANRTERAREADQRNSTALTGISTRAGTAAAGQAVTMRGQDMKAGSSSAHDATLAAIAANRINNANKNRKPAITKQELLYLQANPTPDVRASYDARFGIGTSKKILGK